MQRQQLSQAAATEAELRREVEAAASATAQACARAAALEEQVKELQGDVASKQTQADQLADGMCVTCYSALLFLLLMLLSLCMHSHVHTHCHRVSACVPRQLPLLDTPHAHTQSATHTALTAAFWPC